MLVVADTHVHLYPCHDPALFLDAACSNLARGHAPDALRILALTERFDCHAFRDLAGGVRPLPSPWSVQPAGEAGGLTLLRDGAARLHLVAGRQIVTRERIEILALGVDAEIPDGLPAAQTLARIRDEGAIPVLSWAPGKWFFERGRLVQSLLRASDPSSLVIGDTSLRPKVWPTPRLMREAVRRGFRVVAGSDPLPFAGDERLTGTYGVAAEFDATPEKPVTALRRLLLDASVPLALHGRRGGALAVAVRLRANARSKRP